MSAKTHRLDSVDLSCAVCLHLLRDPVTIACGHSYCSSCVKSHWDREAHREAAAFSCPQCRQSFSPRPALARNTMLAKVMEEKTRRGQFGRHDTEGNSEAVCSVGQVLQSKQTELENRIKTLREKHQAKVKECQSPLKKEVAQLKGALYKLNHLAVVPRERDNRRRDGSSYSALLPFENLRVDIENLLTPEPETLDDLLDYDRAPVTMDLPQHTSFCLCQKREQELHSLG
ncbi:hypothetical protein WMY93_008869 [Mugilogobius chulae]|uniref:RING-type domain-containing protein n=1 Tax=Mugilogobius chulae TaxID=88201 RepID=A0AAW0PL40_9GOBI